MTGGLGFTTLMKGLTKTNRNFLIHTDKVKSQKDNLTYLTNKEGLKYKEVSKEELDRIKAKFKNERLLENRKTILISSISLLIVIILIAIIYFIIRL